MRAIEGVSRETMDRLIQYVRLLTRWNSRIRLTGLDVATNSDDFIAESLELGRWLDGVPACALDIGSGNGLPAIPLSIVFGIPYTLVEADRRKAAFLREVAREVGCPASVEACRIEDMPLRSFELITARAFGSLSQLLRLAHPRQMSSTVCLFPKGPDIDTELAAARVDWSFLATSHPAQRGRIVEIRSIAPRA